MKSQILRSVTLIILFFICFSKADSQNIHIDDKKSLVKYAEPILFKTYGNHQILSERPYIILFKGGVWIMHGTLPNNSLGGTFYIEIMAKDGKVIKMTHYK